VVRFETMEESISKLEAMRQMCQVFFDWKEPKEHGPMFRGVHNATL
jgi:hypothetical protein